MSKRKRPRKNINYALRGVRSNEEKEPKEIKCINFKIPESMVVRKQNFVFALTLTGMDV